MDHVSHRGDLEALRAKVARIESEPSFDFAAADLRVAQVQPEPIPEELPPVVGQFEDDQLHLAMGAAGGQPFGEWLLGQKDRKGWISDLAKWAKSDIRFPKHGSPDDVRKRLTEIQAEGDAFEALDDAEMDWLAL